MNKDSSNTAGNLLEAQRRSLEHGLEELLEELRPALAKAARIQRRLDSIDALASHRAELGAAGSGKRMRFSTEARMLQVLDLVSERPEQLRRKDIADALGVQIARAGKLVNRLLAEGYLEERGRGTLASTGKVGDLTPVAYGQPEVAIEAGPWQSVGKAQASGATDEVGGS